MVSTTVHADVPAPPERLPLLTCIGWGAGTLVTSLLLYTSNTLLLRYLTDFVGIAAGTAGTLLALSKVVDALVDPPIGVLTDRTRSRMGRRRPWLLGGTLLGAVTILLMFSIPRLESEPLLLAYVGLLLCLYAVAFSTFNIPYLAMPTEMTTRADDRSYLIQFRVYASAAAALLATSLAPTLLQALGRTHAAHAAVAATLAPFILFGGLFAVWATRHAPATRAHVAAPVRLRDQVEMIARNRPALALLACDLTRLIGVTSQSVAAAFFTTYYLRASDYVLGMLLGASTVAVIVSQPLWVAVGARTSKRVAYAIASVGFAIVAVSWLLATPGESAALILVRAVLGGVCSGGLFLMGNSMMPDAVEHDYHLTGHRREGNLVAMFTFCEQLAHALAVAGVGWVLSASGFVPKSGGGAVQDPQVIDGIRMVYALGPALFVLLSCTWLRWFDPILAGSRHARPQH
jgi:GPH family glycoside/pentoside/hexuronide:cation symporter